MREDGRMFAKFALTYFFLVRNALDRTQGTDVGEIGHVDFVMNRRDGALGGRLGAEKGDLSPDLLNKR